MTSANEQLVSQQNKHPIIETYLEGKISAGKAAELLGLSKAQFLDLLDEHNLPYLDAGPEELKREVAAAKAASRVPGPHKAPSDKPGP
ncbi:MAG TPA: UPF0175 family protein [Thermoanaerobaculia bacterium]|nr:UPF0175 family protein [Thermoanaerobaculia bacterium]